MLLIQSTSWKQQLEAEFEKVYFKKLINFIDYEYQNRVCFPNKNRIFSALDFCPFNEVKVVLVGQDPYHGLNQANGLCFSVNDGQPHPPSLKNIYKEIQNDLGIPIPRSGNLERWAKQGVLMLNSILTVRKDEPGSHQNKGWEQFTDTIIQLINKKKQPVVFLLWGKYAQEKGRLIEVKKHKILLSAHPSPLAAYRGFFGCKHFSQTNDYLLSNALQPINW